MELRWGYLVLYMLAVPLYVLLTVGAPTEGAARYNISPSNLLLLQFTIIIPIVLIWLAGLKGVSTLKEYAMKLHDDERIGMKLVLRGLQWLVLGLIVTSLFGTLRSYYVDESFFPVYQIVNNYLRIGFSLVGIYFVYRGSRELLGTCRIKGIPNAHRTWTFFIAAAITLLSGLLIYGNPTHNSTSDPQVASFYMNDFFIAATILAPNLIAWVLGILAALQLKKYSDQLSELRHKQGFIRMAGSIVAIVGISIALQLLVAISVAVSKLSIGVILAIVYLLLIGYAIAYLLLASSAKKLRQAISN